MELKDRRHWEDEDYRQRMSIKDWKKILLDHDDKVIFHGKLRQLKAKNLGASVYEVFKEPQKVV